MGNQEVFLYRKVALDQRRWKDRLLKKKPAEILEQAREYVLREMILDLVSCRGLPEDWAKALQKSPHPLTEIYQAVEDKDLIGGLEDEVWDVVLERAQAARYCEIISQQLREEAQDEQEDLCGSDERVAEVSE